MLSRRATATDSAQIIILSIIPSAQIGKPKNGKFSFYFCDEFFRRPSFVAAADYPARRRCILYRDYDIMARRLRIFVKKGDPNPNDL